MVGSSTGANSITLSLVAAPPPPCPLAPAWGAAGALGTPEPQAVISHVNTTSTAGRTALRNCMTAFTPPSTDPPRSPAAGHSAGYRARRTPRNGSESAVTRSATAGTSPHQDRCGPPTTWRPPARANRCFRGRRTSTAQAGGQQRGVLSFVEVTPLSAVQHAARAQRNGVARRFSNTLQVSSRSFDSTDAACIPLQRLSRKSWPRRCIPRARRVDRRAS